MQKIFSYILFVVGVALIVCGYLLWGGSLQNIVLLNLIISILVFSLYFVDILCPPLSLKSSDKGWGGSLGIRWTTTLSYSLAAVGFMCAGNLIEYPLSLGTQILVHCVLIFFMLLGYFATYNAARKADTVHQTQENSRGLLIESRQSANSIYQMAQLSANVPSAIQNELKSLNERMRYISPSLNTEAIALEKDLLDSLNKINVLVSQKNLDIPALEKAILASKLIYKNRKQIYSK